MMHPGRRLGCYSAPGATESLVGVGVVRRLSPSSWWWRTSPRLAGLSPSSESCSAGGCADCLRTAAVDKSSQPAMRLGLQEV